MQGVSDVTALAVAMGTGRATGGTHLAAGRAVRDRTWAREVMGCDRATEDMWLWVRPEVSGCVGYGQGEKSPVRAKEQVTVGTR